MLLICKVKILVYTNVEGKMTFFWFSLIYCFEHNCFSCLRVGAREYTYKTMKNVSRFWRPTLLAFTSCREFCLQPHLFYLSGFQCIQTVLIPCSSFLHVFWAQVFLLCPQDQASGVGSEDLIHITAASYFPVLMGAFLLAVHPDCFKDYYSSSLLYKYSIVCFSFLCAPPFLIYATVLTLKAASALTAHLCFSDAAIQAQTLKFSSVAVLPMKFVEQCGREKRHFKLYEARCYQTLLFVR